jgi:integrase/recombinase XerC
MGKTYERNGVHYVDLRIQGRRIRRKAGKSKKLAELLLKDLEIKAERGQLGFLDRKEVSIKDFLEEFRQYSQANHRPASQARYRAVVNNFLEFLQKHTQINRLRQITPDVIEKYRIYRRSMPITRNGGSPEKAKSKPVQHGVKAYTVNFEVKALRTIFFFAIRSNYLEANPIKGFKFLKTDDSKQRRFLSESECRRLLEHAEKEDYPVFALFLNTGMRRSELVNLEWSDIDFKNGIIKIQRKSFWLPKSGEREIPMNEMAEEILMKLPKRGNFVFTDKKGKKLNPDLIRLRLKETAKKAKVENLTEIHALRHTFASQLITNGVDLPSVQKLMGHTNIQTTMIYTHQTTDHLKSAISKLNIGRDKKSARVAEFVKA